MFNFKNLFTYSEEISGWFYDVVMNDGTEFGCVITDDYSHFDCYGKSSASPKIAEFTAE